MIKYIKIAFAFLTSVLITCAVAFWQGMHSFLFAWVLNLMLMLSILTLTQELKPKLKSTYYNSREWELGGEVYKWFGINVFRKLLVWLGWEKLNKAANPVRKDVAALKHLEYSTRQSEFGHLIVFLIVSVFALWIGFHYGFRDSVWLISLNVLLNIYPMGVQRYNRPRIQKLLKEYCWF